MGRLWWDFVSSDPTRTSVLAFVTTLHCALLVLRNHRPRGFAPLILAPSFLFAVFPWFLSTPAWLVTGLVSHLGWFIACETLIPPAATRLTAAAPVAAAGRAGETGSSAPTKPAATTPLRQFEPLQVLATFDETPEIRTFRFARPPGFDFKAGQFLMVRAEISGKPAVRCYSISSSPSTLAYLEISVRRQGPMSTFLHEQLRPGATLFARGPAGPFIYPKGEQPIVFLAGGIGITPLLSMLRHALESEPDRPVTLILSARTEDHIPFRDEIRFLSTRYSRQLRVAVTLSGGSPSPAFYSGRIDHKLIAMAVDRIGEAVYMICGPSVMIDDMRTLLASLGVPSAQIHFEKFQVASAGAAQAAEEPVEGPCAVTLQRRDRTISVIKGQSILEALEGAGEELPSMCRAGVCGTCAIRLVSGEVEGDFDALDQERREAGLILTCVARPKSSCVIDA